MEILGKIFGSPARVKIMRLFLLNRDVGFKNKEISLRSRVTPATVRSEMRTLQNVGFVKKRGEDWSFNPSFKYGTEFESLLISTDSIDKDSILENFKRAGKIKLLIVSGIFIKNKDSRLDVLVVGDKMKKSTIEEGIHRMEAEIGAELTYATFETKEFIYRLNMYDKLIRDVLDFPHEVITQAKELSTQTLKKA